MMSFEVDYSVGNGFHFNEKFTSYKKAVKAFDEVLEVAKEENKPWYLALYDTDKIKPIKEAVNSALYGGVMLIDN